MLATATALPIALVCWLGSRMIVQEREIDRQRRREALEIAVGRLAIEIEQRLRPLETALTMDRGLRFAPEGITADRTSPVLFQPISLLSTPEPSGVFANGEQAEHRERNLVRAASAYRALTSHRDEQVRAGARIRLARVLLKQRNLDAALAVYSQLESERGARIDDVPAPLLAQAAIARALERFAVPARATQAAVELAASLAAGGWLIDRAAFDEMDALARRLGGPAGSTDAIVRSESAGELWRSWQSGTLPASGRRMIQRSDGTSAVAIWRSGATGPVADIIPVAIIEKWIAQDAENAGVVAVVVHPDRGPGARQTHEATFGPAETGLPFGLALSMRATATTSGGSDRWLTLYLVLATASLLILGAGYGAYRATARELRLAREQADFVSAVSHEFRTPLTSMRHLLDLLTSRGITDARRHAHYHDLLGRETERLHRMVESLLSFGRIEAGAHKFSRQRVSVPELVEQVVADFHNESLARDRDIRADCEPGLVTVGDPEALSRVLWNLVENAAKYSPPGSPVSITARQRAGSVLIAVTDRGPGVPAAERERIFQKFVRGSTARRDGVRGVGIGLALVRQIVQGHSGRVGVESTPGDGSTFTIELPFDADRTESPASPLELSTRG